jgi:hypothetical protein
MPKTELLDHPDLRKVWDVLESNAPIVEWTDVASVVHRPLPARSVHSLRRAVAVLGIVGLVLFTGNESMGVFAARRALATGSAVTEQPRQLPLETIDTSKPWPEEILRDLSVGDNGIFALTETPEGVSDQWLLTEDGWVSLGLDVSLITGGETFDGIQYLAGRLHAGEAGDTAVILRLGSTSQDWETVLTVTGGNLTSLMAVDGELVALGYEVYETPRAWTSSDGTSWSVHEVEHTHPAYLGAGTSDGSVGIGVGYQDNSLPLIERRNPSIWLSDAEGALRLADAPDLGPLGFGYSIGGFRLAEGIEDAVHSAQGFFSYTGYLQVWDGIQDLTLDPREAWASLVLRSENGTDWTAHVLSDLAIYQAVPFGGGFLAAATLPPASDTQISVVDREAVEVGSRGENKLYYSEDGLTWQEVVGSPTFGKPLLTTTESGDVLAVDEDAVEDTSAETTPTYLIRVGN